MKRAFEIALEIAAGLTVVAAVYISAVYFPHSDFSVKWMELCASTVIIFGYSIYWTRGLRKTAMFWWLWAGFLLLHLTISVSLLRSFSRWPLIFFVYTTLAEFAFIFPILTRALVRKRV